MGLHLTIYHLLCYPALEQSLQQAVVQDKQDTASSAHHVPGPPKMVLSGLTTEPTVTPVAVQEMFHTRGRMTSPACGRFRRNDGEGITSPPVQLLYACTTSEMDDRSILFV